MASKLIPCVCLVLFLASFRVVSSQAIQEKVNMIVEITRHGARAPIFKPFDDSWMGNLQMGDLTAVGHRQHFLLGKEVASRYPSIFTGKLKAEEFYVRSSGIQRTVNSATSHVMGLWNHFDQTNLPFSNGDNRIEPPAITHDTKDIDFQTPLPYGYLVTPIHSETPEEDHLLRPLTKDSCPLKFNDAIKFRSDMNDKLKDNKALIDVVTEAMRRFGTAWDGKDPYKTCVSLGDFMNQDHFNNPSPKIPKSEVLFQKIYRCYEYDLSGLHQNLEYTKNIFAPLLLEVVEKLKDKSEKGSNSPVKYHYYSAHDSNLVAILALFGTYDPKCIREELEAVSIAKNCGTFPEVASNMIFELVSEKDVDFVRTKFNFETIDICGLKNQDKDFRCPISQFAETIRSKVNPDWQTYCGYKPKSVEKVNEEPSQGHKLAARYRIISIIVLVINAFLLVGVIFCIGNIFQSSKKPPVKPSNDVTLADNEI